MKIRFIVLVCLIVNLICLPIGKAYSNDNVLNNTANWSKSLYNLQQNKFFPKNVNFSVMSSLRWNMPLYEIQSQYNVKRVGTSFEGTITYRMANLYGADMLIYLQNDLLYKVEIIYSTYEGLSYEENINLLSLEYGKPKFNNEVEAIWEGNNTTMVFNDNGGAYKLTFFNNQLSDTNFKYISNIKHKLSTVSNVATGKQLYTNLDLKYPLVYMNNIEMQNKINTDIAKKVYELKMDYDKGDFYSGWMRYKIKYEDNQYLSLVLTCYRYNLGAAHGMYYGYGLLYNKNTGERIPLKNFVSSIKIEDLNSLAVSVYNENMIFLPKHSYIDSISENYYLGGNGIVYLMYQPYKLSGFANGIVSVELEPKTIDYFNRKNNS